MKIELKYLAPYLPYGLRVTRFYAPFKKGYEIYLLNGISEDFRYKKEDLDEGDDLELLKVKQITYWVDDFGLNSIAHNVKLLLHPISDLFNGNYEHILDEFSDLELEAFKSAFLAELRPSNYLDKLPYSVAQMLFKEHFDIFGLIDKGLAIDINEIKNL